MIVFDSNYLIAFLRPDAKQPPRDEQNNPVERFEERIRALVAQLNEQSTLIGVPAPVLAEILVKYDESKDEYIKILKDRYRFEILPFGTKAALEAADLIATLVAETKQCAEQWAKVKFDIQIVSIAKSEMNVTMLYADDKKVVNNAKRLQIPVMRIWELPLPPPPKPKTFILEQSGQGKLAYSAVDDEEQADTKQEQHANTAQEAEPATAETRGSDNGRPQSQAAAKESESTPAPVPEQGTPRKPKPAKEGGLGESGT